MRKAIEARGYQLPLGEKSLVMGILNLTPDSFSDGGLWVDEEKALAHAREMRTEGADLIDVGGESTRPGSRPVSAAEELQRISSVTAALTGAGIPLSVDTWKSEVAEAVLKSGVPFINDIYALRGDPEMARVCSEYGAGLILMNHPAWYWPKRPEARVFPFRESLRQIEPGEEAVYEKLDARQAMLKFLSDSLEIALRAGIPEKGIILDPGIGFGLTPEENLTLCNHLEDLKALGFPVLLAPSRKRFIRRVLGEGSEEAEIGTSATIIWGIQHGADMLRVHDVKCQLPYIRMADALLREKIPS